MKILMFFHGGSLNRGCEAIVRTAVNLIKEKTPNAEITLASRKPYTDVHIPNIDYIILDRNSEIKPYSIDWIKSSFLVKFFKDESFAQQKIHASLIEKIPNYDVFLSIGGDNYCYGEQPGIYEIDKQIKKAGKKLVLWGASIGKEDLSETKIKDLRIFDLILARETLTQNILEEARLTNVKIVADGAFLMEKNELPLPEKWVDGNTIGFNFSPLVFSRNPESKKAAFSLVQHILNTTDAAICLTPHVIYEGNDDHGLLKEFYENFKNSGRIILLPENLDATQLKGYIARMRFFIGARTHATIAAYSSFVPTMVLGYSIKSKGIAKDIFGEEKLVLNIDEISNPEILISKFEEMKMGEALIKETLKNKIPEIMQNARQAEKYLMALK